MTDTPAADAPVADAPPADAPLADVEFRRLRLRSWRRGMREMDLILGGFADAELGAMAGAERAAYRALLDENDQELYGWVRAPDTAPDRHGAMLARIRVFHGID